ncbi:MAG: FAD-dependent oxidoreductase [Lentisphaeria bacterium]|nr:MAG: FAD-dependent oxidoreductase [Lentisphaeria bacterium]
MIERYGVLGGLATTCLMGPFFGYSPVEGRYAPGKVNHVNPAEHILLGGIPVELVRRLQKIGGALPDGKIDWSAISFDPELFKKVCDDIVLESGVKVFLHAWVVDTILEENRIRAIVIESKSGRQAITGKLFIDATGDADLAHFAGAPYTKGAQGGRPDPVDGHPLPDRRSSPAHPGGDRPRQRNRRRRHPPGRGPLARHQLDRRGRLDRPARRGLPDTTRAAGDGTSMPDLTRAEFKIRRDTWEMFDFARKNVPGFENAYLIDFPFVVGVRETRQITGLYQLSDEDVMECRKHPDTTIARGCWWIDIHCPLGNIYPGRQRDSLCSANCKVEQFQKRRCIMKSRCSDQLPENPVPAGKRLLRHPVRHSAVENGRESDRLRTLHFGDPHRNGFGARHRHLFRHRRSSRNRRRALAGK